MVVNKNKKSTDGVPGTQQSKNILMPLAITQFLASYSASSMNVAISNIVSDLHTTITGVQTSITVFTLTMAALMIPGSKLTDIVGRKKCFIWGLIVYGAGALITAFSPTIGVMIVGYSLLEGIGSALMIPPIYIITTVTYPDVKSRAHAFALISAMAGLGAAAGPLIGGLITTTLSWRVSFGLQALAILWIIRLAGNIRETGIENTKMRLDIMGSILSGLGLVAIVAGILMAGTYGWFQTRKNVTIGNTVLLQTGQISPVIICVGIGLLFLVWFAFHIHSMERRGKDPLLSSHLFSSKAVIPGLITQNIQWLIMMGTFFVTSVFIQVVWEYSAIATGLVLTPTTIGLLLSSSRASILAKKYSQKRLIIVGFILTITGMIVDLLLVRVDSGVFSFVPGLFLIGIGIGIMLTASVNVVQSSVPEKDQGEISGLSRSVSNLGSSFGTAISGAVLISMLISGINQLTEESTVLTSEQKQQVQSALQGDVSAVSNAQIDTMLKGQPSDVVDAVTRINALARNRALAIAQLVTAVLGLVGLIAALLLPGETVGKNNAVQ